MKTLPKQFVSRWKACYDCHLAPLARSRVIGRGDIPADVLFIGEAPGEKEDLIGSPFVGPAGQLLTKIIGEVQEGEGDINCSPQFTYYLTNLVACCPWTDKTRSEYSDPSPDSIAACSSRLNALIEYVQPKTIILVGKIAKKHFEPPPGISVLSITHPAAILHSRVVPETSVTYHKIKDALRQHLKSVLSPRES